MRLARLDLLGYGHFTDRTLEFPDGDPDLHVVFGPNEAGKSTALAALEDLLFGIPLRSPHGFLHPYGKMRIGGVLEDAAGAFGLVRRKSAKDSLVDAAGVPLVDGERRLRALLGGADRDFFARMFCLDHGRLEEGGRAMLDPEDDAGQAIFAAGAGLANFREALRSLSEEADGLWGPRRAGRRRYHAAEKRNDEARRTLRECTLTTGRWRELRNARDEARRDRDRIDEEYRSAFADWGRLSRIRRVLADVRRREAVMEKLRRLEGAAALPDNAAKTLAASRQTLDENAARADVLSRQLGEIEREIGELVWDRRLVEESARIAELDRRGIEIAPERDDLPKREAELRTLETELRRRAGELGWRDRDAAALAERLPPPSATQEVQRELRALAGLNADADGRAAELETHRDRLGRLLRRGETGSEPPDPSELAAAIGALLGRGDVAERRLAAERDLSDAERRVRELRERLRPAIEDEERALAVAAPSKTAIRAHGAVREELGHDRRELRRKRTAADAETGRLRSELELLRDHGDSVSPEEVAEARRRRDDLWRRVRAGLAENGESRERPPDLSDAVEEAMRDADRLADRRFETAEASALLAERSRALAGAERLGAALERSGKALDERDRELEREWNRMWDAAPFEPLAPDVMEQWADTRAALAEAVDRRREAESRLAVRRGIEREAAGSLADRLTKLGRAPDPENPLAVLLASAEDLHGRLEEAVRERRELESDIAQARDEEIRLRKLADEAGEARSRWHARWSELVRDLGLPADTSPETAEARIETMDRMRRLDEEIERLREDRISKIARDIAAFETQVSRLVSALAPDLADRTPDDAVRELERRRTAAERNRDRHEARTAEAEKVRKRIAELEPERARAGTAIGRLAKAAGTEGDDALDEAVRRSDERRALERTLRQLETDLASSGDGIPLEDLVRDCVDEDPNRIAVKEKEAGERLQETERRRNEAAVALSEAERALDEAGGGDAAARAEAERQDALSGMTQAAELYVRTRGSAILLRWAIDRYRRERQGPLLARAGQTFGILTGGSFSALRIDHDSRDRPILTGTRPDGSDVPVGGMSDGTVDQLYLALRLAAIGEYLQRTDGLPFVADDLFVNFDDARAAAGFEAIRDLAGRTQVLFFTHHRHLVGIARETLGAGVSVVACEGRETEAAP